MLKHGPVLLCLLAGCPSAEERRTQDAALEQLQAYERRLQELEDKLADTERKLDGASRQPGERSDLHIGELAHAVATNEPIGPVVRIVLTQDEILLDGEPVTQDELEQRLRPAARDPEVSLILRADADVPHGRVTEVLDAAKVAGIQRFSMGAKVPEPIEEPESQPDG